VFSSRIEKKSNLWYTRIPTVPNKGISYYYDFINKFSNAKHFIEKYKDTTLTTRMGSACGLHLTLFLSYKMSAAEQPLPPVGQGVLLTGLLPATLLLARINDKIVEF
jgi:hypothetical protein